MKGVGLDVDMNSDQRLEYSSQNSTIRPEEESKVVADLCCDKLCYLLFRGLPSTT